MYDVVIIGAGVSGSATARELSRYKLNIKVVEKGEDVCSGTSKANSGIVHAGFDAEPGSMMAKLNVKGNAMMESLAKELDFPFQRIGSLVLCFHEEDRPKLEAMKEQGEKNQVPGLRIIEAEELRKMEPNISPDAVAALHAPSGGIVCPFGLNIALAENACVNGVEFQFDTQVESIEKTEGGFLLKTNQGDIIAKCVVNAAGVYADQFHNMISEEKIHIVARKGEYYLLDKSAADHVSHTIFQLPGKYGKGVLVTPTTHGNLLVGPTAKDIEDKEGTNTTTEGMSEVGQKAQKSVVNLPLRQVITSFAGLRAHEEGHDFIIKEVEDAPGFFDCAGIESPGLTSAPAIGEEMAELIFKKLKPEKKEEFISHRKGILNPRLLSKEEWKNLVKEQPSYGTVICRCESITEGEIIDAIHRPLGAKSLDGVKRRTRAGMGRCQSGFCSPRTMEILSRELKVPMESLTKCGGGSNIIQGTTKDSL
ncbi:MAG: FAD/NAD(P)-binding oxidoreductase [Clostridia bacterium]|nr:FAD/NAD(P)-binding oxidoreductase [Clostridia bacterium]NCC44479.1 FAD/NAD(P)-binding oxidoreductase [Clostridia bacterium]